MRRRAGTWFDGFRAVVAALSLAVTDRAAATPADQAFLSANAILAQGKAAEAAAMYEDLIRTNGVTVSALHNLGIARLQAGEPGRALAAWRRAEWLDPRDRGVRGNIGYVRRQLDASDPVPFRPGPLSLAEWGVLTAGVWWLLGGLVLVGRFSPRIRARVGGVRVASAVLALGLGTWTALAAAARYRGPSAVIVSREAEVRIAPAAEAGSGVTLSEGAEVRVLRWHRDWCEVARDGRLLGWVAGADVEPHAPWAVPFVPVASGGRDR